MPQTYSCKAHKIIITGYASQSSICFWYYLSKNTNQNQAFFVFCCFFLFRISHINCSWFRLRLWQWSSTAWSTSLPFLLLFEAHSQEFSVFSSILSPLLVSPLLEGKSVSLTLKNNWGNKSLDLGGFSSCLFACKKDSRNAYFLPLIVK